MRKTAVLGAGYMGGAVTFPLAQNGIEVNLWGTWLDDDIIDSTKRGYHPKLKKKIPENVRLFYSDELKEALNGVDAVIIAVTSEGFLPVFRRLLYTTDADYVFFSLTKGFVAIDSRVRQISESAEILHKEKFASRPFLWVSVGGPVKAVELSNKIPTATVFGSNSTGMKEFIPFFKTEYYRISWSEDTVGVELSSAFKNSYAIAMGICDGMYQEAFGENYHNFKALIFNQAIREMALIVQRGGGKRDTVFDLAGVGDLYVTSASGRNGRYGVFVGKGEAPAEAYERMFRQGEIAEGYHTLRNGKKFIEQLGDDLVTKLPLFNTLYRIIFLDYDYRDEMHRFSAMYEKEA